jgi:hypothetical protein
LQKHKCKIRTNVVLAKLVILTILEASTLPLTMGIVCVCVFNTITNPINKLLDKIEWGYQLSSLVVEDIIKLLSSNKSHIIESSPYILIAYAIF